MNFFKNIFTGNKTSQFSNNQERGNESLEVESKGDELSIKMNKSITQSYSKSVSLSAEDIKVQKKAIKDCLVHHLEKILDEPLMKCGFTRRKNSLIYFRKLGECTQRIDLRLSHFPREDQGAVAVIYPYMDVSIPEIDDIIDILCFNNMGLLAGMTEAKSRQPIEMNSRKQEKARWYIYQPDSIRSLIESLNEFLHRWTLPLLDEYTSAKDVLREDIDQNAEIERRILRDYAQMLRVVIAALVYEGVEAARIKANHYYGRKRSRRLYKDVFDYIEAQESSTTD